VALPQQFGRYRIIRQIGRGGMGSVYLAHDTQLDRLVALKVPHFHADDGPQVVERFLREARAAATIDHPSICPVYDAGEIDGTHYVTMAYIDGRPLSDLIQRGRPLPPRSAAVLVRKLALALHEAHRRGIIHRDLKPSNVMVKRRREPVVMDFGLARRTHQDDARLTRSGAILGTPAYMAPEQVQGDTGALGPACDIYSLAVILFELLTRQLPFQGPTPAVLAQVLTREPPSPGQLRPDLDPGLDEICRRAMARRPEDRFASMADLAAALGRYLKTKPEPQPDAGERAAGSGETGPSPVASHPVPAAPAVGARPGLPAVTAESPRGGLVRLAIFVAVAGLAALAAYFMLVPARPTRSLIVLPIEAPADDPELQALAGSLTDVIVADSSLIGRLKGAAPADSARAAAAGSPAEAGRRLGAAAVLTGKLARHGDRMTLQVQLIDVQTSRVLWRDESYQAVAGHNGWIVGDWAPLIAADVRRKLDATEAHLSLCEWLR
jgi:TolB-like protein/predicted Ser/Thr protein kinase